MLKHHTARIQGYGLLLLASVFYGSYGIWSHLMGNTFAPFYQAWVRSVVIILMMLPLLFATKAFRKIERQDWLPVGVFLAFCVCTQVPLYYAFNHAPIGTVQLVFYAMFIIAAYIVGKFYLGEDITRLKLISIALALVGLALVFGMAVLSVAPIALCLAALNGVASGSETVSSKKVSEKYAPGLLIFWGWVFTFLTHLPLSLLLGEHQVRPELNAAWGYLLAYSAVNATAFWLSLEGFRHVDGSIGGLIGLTEVIFAIVFAAIFLHQHLTWIVAIGGACIITAAMLPDAFNIIRRRHAQRPVEPVLEL